MTRYLKFALTLIMTLTTGLPVTAAAAGAPACAKPLIDKCKNAALKVAAEHQFTLGQVAVANKDNLKGGAEGESAAKATAAAAMDDVAAACKSDVDKCKACGSSTPKQKQDTETCKKALTEMSASHSADALALRGDATGAADTAKAAGTDQPAAPAEPASTGGGMGGMGSAALGALAGGLLGYMMGKKSEKKDKKSDNDDALQDNGTLDCSKKDAYVYSDCNSYLSAVCSQKMTSNSFASDESCQNFSKRYCGSSSANSDSSALSSNSSSSPAKGVTGEGLANDPGFCQNVLAHNFCKQTGRNECPSCLQIAANQAPACVNNPALCMAQNSAEQINMAKQSCPTDPIFANPANIKTGNQIVTELNNGGTLPVVTLPNGSSPSGLVATASAGAPAAGASTAGVVVTQSVQSGVREGQATGPNSQAGYGNGSASSRSLNGVPGAGGNSREIASTTGGYKSASAAMSGPASDVQGQYGPSLFALGTQVIRQHCQAGKLINCP